MKVNRVQFNLLQNQNLKTSNIKNKSGEVFMGNRTNYNNYPLGIESWIEIHRSETDRLENVKTVTLKNNIRLNLDTNSPDNNVAFEFHTKLKDKPQANGAIKTVLAKMIGNCVFDNKKSIDIDLWNGEELEVMIKSDKSNSQEVLQQALQNSYGANLTQKGLDSAKNAILSSFNPENQNNAFKYIYGFKEYSKEDIKNVSLDDVKKLYGEITNNSMTLCSASLPKNTDSSTVNQIKAIIEKQIPNQKPFDVNSMIKQVKPIRRNVILNSKSKDDRKKVSKYYTIQDNDTLKDSVLFMLIEQAFKKVGKQNLPQNISEVFCSRSGTFFNKYFEIYSESNNQNADIEGYINSTIRSLTESTLNEQDFNAIKEKVSEERRTEFKKSESRASLISEIFTQGSFGYKEFSSVLNSVTPQELQQTAQRYFNTPSIIKISK